MRSKWPFFILYSHLFFFPPLSLSLFYSCSKVQVTQESQCTLVNFALVIALTHKVIEDAADAKDTIGQDKGGGRCEWREREDWMMR